VKNTISLRVRFVRGDSLTGIIDFIGAPMAVEILARAGIDFVIIDMEHCPMDLGPLAHLIRTADAAGIAALVRAARYAPEGERGACPIVRATGYWPEDWSAYAQKANREVMLLPLIEDRSAIDDVDAIAATHGIDGLFIGPYDLSVSVGAPSADFDHPTMSAALDRVVASCRRNSKFVVSTIGDRQEADYCRRLVQRGIQGLVLATDALVLLQACQRLVAFTR